MNKKTALLVCAVLLSSLSCLRKASPSLLDRPFKYKTYPTRSLAGMKFGGLLADYTGIRGAVPKDARISFGRNLALMWERKKERSRQNPVVAHMGLKIVDSYCSRSPSSLTVEDYEEIVNKAVSTAHNDLDEEKLAKIERLDKRRAKLVLKIAGSWRGRDFLAYAMTELMPSTDGKLNRQILDFLLRNGGREYVESIPAMYDPYTSFGPYQFTQYAWFDARGVRRGGSKLNPALSKPVPHGSVGELRGDEHHIAAFLFAVDNLSVMVRSLNDKQLTTLERCWKNRHEEVVQFIAAAHNYPKGAHDAARLWLDNGARKSYLESCTRKPRRYATKTRANLRALSN